MARITMQQKPSEKTMEQAFDEFLRYCKIKNLSEHTLSFYEFRFQQFAKWYKGELQDITEEVVNEYVLHLQSRDTINDVTINTTMRALRVIFYYFMELGYIEKFKITLPRAEKKVKETYTDEELNLLLRKPNPNKCRFTEFRNWTLVNFLLGTGVRISTAANVLIGDLDFENGFIILTKVKNKRQHVIPMSTALEEVLIEYLKYRRGTDQDYLFCNQYGQPMTTDGLKQAVKRYNQSRGVMKTSCHAFRHTFAKKYILAGGDMFRLQKILGHSSLDMVKEYVNMFAEDLQKDFDRFNPLDQLAGKKQPISMKRGGRR